MNPEESVYSIYEVMSMKKGAIFDMDGTLLDTEKHYSRGWLVVADDFGLARNPDLPSAMSGTGWDAMSEKLHKFYPEVDADAYTEKVIAYAKAHIGNRPELMPGTIELLRYFQTQKIPMAVASSSDRAVIEEKLQQSGIISYFDVLIGGDEVTHGKPDPEIFLKAAAALHLPIEDCYVFEDSFNGVRAGAASGALTVMIPDQVPPTEEISSLCVLHDSLLEAKEAIQSGILN